MSLPIDPTSVDPRKLAWDVESLYEIIKKYGYHLRDSRLSSYGEGYNYWALVLDTDTLTAAKKGGLEYDRAWGVCAGVLLNAEGKIIGVVAYDYYYNNSTDRYVCDEYIATLKAGVKVKVKYHGTNVWRDRDFVLHRDEREKIVEIELPKLPDEWVPVFKEIIEIWRREELYWVKKTSRGYPVNWESLNEL
jgi:hypothetical protein